TPGAAPILRPSKAARSCLRSCSHNSGAIGVHRMPMNARYHSPAEMPATLTVFPLSGALLLPRGQMPLNIFEPRYVAMIDDALRSRPRLMGMIQPDAAHPAASDMRPPLSKVGCAGRITQLAESGDGRYLIELTGVSRFRVEEELPVTTAYRQCRVSYTP